jgi:ABC-2 type transport system permease protein
LLAAIGVRVPMGEIVWDLSYQTFPGGRLREEFVFVREHGMASDSPITNGLQSVIALMGGHVEAAGKPGFTVKPLLQSRPSSGAREANGIVPKSELFQMNFFGGGPSLNPNARQQVRNADLTLAARVTSEPVAGSNGGSDGGVAKAGVDVIYVADLDLISNQFFDIRRRFLDPNLRFDNVTFVLNCIDTLVGDDSLIELRKRRPILRKLTAVEQAQEVFEKRWQEEKRAAEDDSKKSLDDAQARFDEAVRQIREDASLDEQAKEVKIVRVQQQENRKLDLEKAQIEGQKERRLQEAQHDRDAARKGIHDKYRIVTLLLAVLPGVLLGLFTWFRRGARAAAIVPANRDVQKRGS